MDQRISSLFLSQVLVLALVFRFSCALTPDGMALLELKEGFNGTNWMLKSWRAKDPNPCGWAGVTCHFPDLRVRSINLPYMQLGGIISPSIGKLTRLHRLALHQNSLHGPIPVEIKNCTELRALYLRANYLQGSIPPEFGELKHLTILDLSSNLLGGTIPPSIGQLMQLHFLNLSTNFFSGEIPNVGVLGKFRNSSFVGNLELCGLPVQKLCRGTLGFPAVLPRSGSFPSESSSVIPPTTPGRPSSHFLNGVILGAMSTIGLAIILVLGFLWICLLSRKWKFGQRYAKVDKEVQIVGTKLVTFHGEFPYSSGEMIKKLELLDEEDLVGSGGFGTVYKVVMDDLSAFAIKRIDRNFVGLDELLDRELPILGSIKHINLVNIRGYCRLPSAKLLIHDFMNLGSLDHYLHEYLQTGRATEKSDVYSFGVLLLELVTGKRPTDPSFVRRGLNIVGWMNTLTEENSKLEDILDLDCGTVEVEAMEAILDIAAMCTNANPDERPTMFRVLQMLEEELMSPCLSHFYEPHLNI
ncbi:hypothetical protein M5K25_015044 [Dendrobium thyrsiflorum]|uniref:Protein kinase domain-containing protein n=1 Tax=Dendrobium thyrsiflorum TaxID=117978 RepID=A0ABD0UW98_DENTH